MGKMVFVTHLKIKTMDVYELNKEQEAAFKQLVKAANKCKKLNIGFVNLYGRETAFDKSLIASFDVDAHFEIDCITYGYPSNYLVLGGDSYADDQLLHSFKLTEKGRKVFNKEFNP